MNEFMQTMVGPIMHPEVTAWGHGLDDCQRGEKLYNCPYTGQLAKHWLDGWSFGMELKVSRLLPPSKR